MAMTVNAIKNLIQSIPAKEGEDEDKGEFI
jgi:hypothetical protein